MASALYQGAERRARTPAALASALVGLAWACGGEPEDAEPPPDPALVQELLGEPAPPSAWPASVESLLESTERFVSRQACVADLAARTPSALVEVLLDVGYDDVFADVCAGLEAASTGDAAQCDALSVQPVRTGCRRRVAMLQRDPSLCPADAVLEGREPRCVAWAARHEALCAAVGPADRAACVAVLRGDARGCSLAERARCDAQIARYGSLLEDSPRPAEPAPGASPPPAPELSLTMVRVHPGAEGAATEGEPTWVSLPALERGVVLVADGCALRLHVGERARLRSALAVRLDLPVPGELPAEVPFAPGVASLELVHPDADASARATGTVTLARLDPTLGGTVEGTFAAEVPLRLGALRLTGTFRSFVRDRDPLPAHCAGGRMPAP